VTGAELETVCLWCVVCVGVVCVWCVCGVCVGCVTGAEPETRVCGRCGCDVCGCGAGVSVRVMVAAPQSKIGKSSVWLCVCVCVGGLFSAHSALSLLSALCSLSLSYLQTRCMGLCVYGSDAGTPTTADQEQQELQDNSESP
jgi:hypothetical protein